MWSAKTTTQPVDSKRGFSPALATIADNAAQVPDLMGIFSG